MKSNPYSKFLTPEDHVHIQVCEYIKWKYRGAVVHHSPNSGKRSYFEQYKLKALNVSAGFPDLIVFYPKSKGSKVIAIELKAGKNKATDYQKAWIDHLNSTGVPARVCTGFDQAKEFVDECFAKKAA
jgi:hypothetical protein